MKAKKKKTRGQRRFYVLINGTRASLVHLDGLQKTDGFLLPTGHFVTFRSEEKAAQAIERTKNVARHLQTSLVSEFLFARCADLRPLFGEMAFEIAHDK